MNASIRIDGDPAAVAIVTEALRAPVAQRRSRWQPRVLLGPTAQLGTPQPSTHPKYAGRALARGTVNPIAAAERAAHVAEQLGELQPVRNV